MKRIRANHLSFPVALACPAPDSAAAKTEPIPLPERNPERAIATAADSASPEIASESATESATAPKSAPAPESATPPEPALDYASILNPLLSYELSSGDESRLRFVMHTRGTSDETAAKTTDRAVRAFGLWYRYKHNKSTYLNAKDVETFRLAHPGWPGQDDLREKAETSLFLGDTTPEPVSYTHLRAH